MLQHLDGLVGDCVRIIARFSPAMNFSSSATRMQILTPAKIKVPSRDVRPKPRTLFIEVLDRLQLVVDERLFFYSRDVDTR